MAVASLVLGIIALVFSLFFVGLNWLGVIMGIIGIILGALGRSSAPEKKGISFDSVLIFIATGLGFLLLGAYLLYIIVTYSIPEIISFIKKGNFTFLLPSGLVFFGGLIGGIFGVIIGAKFAKVTISDVCEIFLPYIPLGHAIGRVGCLLAGCCYGIEYDGFLAVYYPNAVSGISQDTGHFPVQLTEVFVNLMICIILIHFSKKAHQKLDCLFVYLSLYSCTRFLLEFLRGDTERGSFGAFSTSQWISLLLLACSATYALIKKSKYSKTN